MTVLEKLASCFKEKPFVAKKFSMLVMGPVVTASLMESTVYSILQQDVKASHLPSYTLDVLIVSLSLLEALTAPILGWFGSQRRRNTMIFWVFALIVATIPSFFMPSFQGEENDNEFCQSNVIVASKEVPTNTISRLVLLLPMIVVSMFTRVACWSHGMGYLCEHPDTGETISTHFGIILTTRVFSFALGVQLLEKSAVHSLRFQLVYFIVFTLVQLLQFKQLSPISYNDDVAVSRTVKGYGFCQSLGRVASNWLVMSQVFAVGFIAAGLWGYGYNHVDMYKVQYFMWKTGELTFYKAMQLNISYAFIFGIVTLWSVFYSAPVMPIFNKTNAMKTASIACLFLVGLYITTAFYTCDKGTVAGLTGDRYNQPTCSSSCSCAQNWNSLDPVCVVDQNQVITYLSPCHAGCDSLIDLNGISVFSNCTCSSLTNLATVGGCSSDNCFSTYSLHQLTFLFILLASLLAFQALIVVILKSVDKRDVSIAFGVVMSVVSLFAFVCGHLGYYMIGMSTCSWSAAGNCQLHNTNYPIIIAITSGILSLIAFITSLVGHIVLRRRKEDIPTSVNQL